MKNLILFLVTILTLSCSGSEESIREIKNEKVENPSIEKDALSSENNEEGEIKVERPKRSKITNSKFPTELLFGIWTIDNNGPHADFHLNKDYFYIVDYDGNGNMPYIIKADSITIFYEDFIQTSIIQKVSKDSLILRNEEVGIVKYVKWNN